MTCGATKTGDGIALTCTMPKGHAGPHGVSVGGLPPFARWA